MDSQSIFRILPSDFLHNQPTTFTKIFLIDVIMTFDLN